MSNNLLSQHLSIPNSPMGQMETVSDKVDSSVLNMRMGILGPMSNNHASHQFAVSNQQMGLVEPMSHISGLQNMTVSNKQMGQIEPKVGNMGLQQLTRNQKAEEMETMLNTHGSQKSVLPSKRKAAVEPLFNNSLPQQSSVANKRGAHMEPLFNSPGLPQLISPNMKTVQMQFMSSTPGSQNLPAPNKRMIRNESISSKSGSQRSQTPKNRTVEPSPKIQTESFEAVRSKMRESLAAALALVCQHPDKAPNEEKNSPHEATTTLRQNREDSQPAEATTVPVDAADLTENPVNNIPSNEACSVDKPNDGRSTSTETFTNERTVNSTQTWKCTGQESRGNAVFPDGDVSFSDDFFVKDELLQGNGLSWAWDIDMEMEMEVVGTKEVQTAEKPQFLQMDVGVDGGDQEVRSPQDLALRIEAELFKLFGGVNKKYKEKGRSLMFNLKDRNNPELRERVMSGDISPQRLCSMTAEELASKELSEWRMAKAEELAQMIVLPDSDVDIRRLVKKTHKGEYHVEVEQDDSVSVEVPVGSTTFMQTQPKDKETETHPSSEADEIKDSENNEGEKSSSENQDPPCSITIPADGSDLMQGLIVDELKDAEFLPPIVSLDEFMESLHSEPPFENLPVIAGQTKLLSNEENSETVDILVASDPAYKDPVDTNTDKAVKMDVKLTKLEVNAKSSESPVEVKTSARGSASTAEHVWEGALQLNISAVVAVIGLFRSGEKTSTKEWPNSLEIKGRVRLDAFEKFLQELPMSRSRAIMVIHFVLKEGSSEDDRASLSELVDSYVVEERLGFAEPAPGVELYFCPPHPRIVEILSRNLSKDHTEILNSTDNTAIGVVVWRKAHISSTISPNSSSHHKHGSKKQHLTSGRPLEKDTNINVNVSLKSMMPFGQPQNPRPQPNNEDDDIPPGFGPVAARDEDDLPEFNFTGNSNLSVPKFSSPNPSRGSRNTTFHQPSQSSPRPVDKMRELIHRYGQTGNNSTARNWQDKRGAGLGIQQWNDDDDDIPEWQPQAPQQPSLQNPPMHGFQQPMQPHMVNQNVGYRRPLLQVGSPIAMQSPSWPQGAASWTQTSGPHGSQPSNLGSRPNAGQYHGVPVIRTGQPRADRRQDAPK